MPSQCMSLESVIIQFRVGISVGIAVIPIPIYFVSPFIHISATGLSGPTTRRITV